MVKLSDTFHFRIYFRLCEFKLIVIKANAIFFFDICTSEKNIDEESLQTFVYISILIYLNSRWCSFLCSWHILIKDFNLKLYTKIRFVQA